MARRKNREGTYETITKPDGSKLFKWKIRLGSGSSQVTCVRSASTNADLRRKVRACVRELEDSGHIATGAGQTLAAFYDRWLVEFVRLAVRPRTYLSYEQMGRTQIKPRLGHVRLHKLTTMHIQAALNDMAADGLSASTRRYFHRLLKMSLDKAVELQLISSNPVCATRPPAASEPVKRVLSGTEVIRLLQAVSGSRYEPFISVMLYTGLRPSECAGLIWSQIDFEAQGMVVVHQLGDVKRKVGSGSVAPRPLPPDSVHVWGDWYLVPVKTKKSRRYLDIHPEAKAALERQATLQLRDRERARDYFFITDLVFATETGRPTSLRNVQRALDAALCRAGLPHFSLHDLRKTFCSHLDGEIHEIQSILGHKNISTTERHYLEVRRDRMRTVIASLDYGTKGGHLL